MDTDNLHAACEELHVVDSLWKKCYNEPSPLRENGIAVLPALLERTRLSSCHRMSQGRCFELRLCAWAERWLWFFLLEEGSTIAAWCRAVVTPQFRFLGLVMAWWVWKAESGLMEVWPFVPCKFYVIINHLYSCSEFCWYVCISVEFALWEDDWYYCLSDSCIWRNLRILLHECMIIYTWLRILSCTFAF